MKKKLILTSMIALGFACPAVADTTTTYYSDEFPNASAVPPEYMQPDYTYRNAAISDNMAGAYEDNSTVYAVPEYGACAISAIAAGSYLPAGATETTGCVDGKYCPGVSGNLTCNASEAQGLTSCPSGYTHSDANAVAADQCYRDCVAADLPLHYSGTVTGRVYSNGLSGSSAGDGVNLCQPETCANGWTLRTEGVGGDDLVNLVGNYEGSNSAAAAYGSLMFNGDYGNQGYDYYNFDGVLGEWAAEIQNIVIQGRASVVAGRCYCNVTKYRETGHWYTVSSPWVYMSNWGSSEGIDDCTRSCAGHMRESRFLSYRTELLGSVVAPSFCNANTIKIKWYGTTAQAVAGNNAGTVTYGGDIRTPVAPDATQAPAGQVFKGWRFSATAPSTGSPAN